VGEAWIVPSRHARVHRVHGNQRVRHRRARRQPVRRHGARVSGSVGHLRSLARIGRRSSVSSSSGAPQIATSGRA
jgi:hypothetical protein